MRVVLVGLVGLLILVMGACSGSSGDATAVAGSPATAPSPSSTADPDDTASTPAAPPSLDVPPSSVPEDQTVPSGLTQPGARLELGQPARVLVAALDATKPTVVDYIVNRVAPAPDAQGRSVFRIRITRTAITPFSNALTFSSLLFDAVDTEGRTSKPVFDTECKSTLVDSMTKGQREDFCVAVSLPQGAKVAVVRYQAGPKFRKESGGAPITWRP